MVLAETAISPVVVRRLAAECGFELAGVASARPSADFGRYRAWAGAEMAAQMSYLTDRRAEVRRDPCQLLSSAKSVICVGKLYRGPEPSPRTRGAEFGWIARYAWGDDYHDVLAAGLSQLEAALRRETNESFEARAVVDTAPLLERSYAQSAGLGWVGKNTCLISQGMGSWFFLGELLVSLELDTDEPAPGRCGTCSRCIDACPTFAIVPAPGAYGGWSVDSRRCIAYYTIEHRGPIPADLRAGFGAHVFGCDVCQDVCPWNRRAGLTTEPAFAPRQWPFAHEAVPLDLLASLSEQEFRDAFRGSPVCRAKYLGFLRNVAVAIGNSGVGQYRPSLERLAAHPDPVVAEHARWGLERLGAA